MKRSLKLLFVAALGLCATAAGLWAQPTDDNNNPPPPREHRARMKHMREERLKRLDEKLHLTAEQKTQIQAIWDKAEQQAIENRKEVKAEMQDRREKRREAMKAMREQVRAVLTPEQQKAFDEMPRMGPPPPPSGAHPESPGDGEGR